MPISDLTTSNKDNSCKPAMFYCEQKCTAPSGEKTQIVKLVNMLGQLFNPDVTTVCTVINQSQKDLLVDEGG